MTGTCQICSTQITAIHADVDPRTATLMFMAQCGHLIPHDQAKAGWEHGLRWHTPAINGANLFAAERRRQTAEEGYTPEHDVEHDVGELAWAAWCYIDRANSDPDQPPASDEPPTMWPWEPEAWKPEKSPLRLIIIAGALLAAEADVRLARGERP